MSSISQQRNDRSSSSSSQQQPPRNNSKAAMSSSSTVMMEQADSSADASFSKSAETGKPRMSRQLKRERKEQKAALQQQHQQSTTEKQQAPKKKDSSIAEKLLKSAQRSSFTQSVYISRSYSGQDSLPPPPAAAVAESTKRIRVVTSCLAFDEAERADNSNSDAAARTANNEAHTNIYIKPLLVLDLNGILCHRVRRRPHDVKSNEQQQVANNLPMSAYRRTTGQNIAMTPVIPRPNVEAFLTYLDEHFCLAIWTSAKAKTSSKLVRELVPEAIAQRLLFVWAQHKCHVEQTNNTGKQGGQQQQQPLAPHEIVYKKDLSQVWKQFPLWNSTNTLLMDDSPNKCVAWEENAVHPPPLNGRKVLQLPHEADRVASDESNVWKQREFFERLVQHWKDHPTTHDWDTECEDAVIHNRNGAGLLQFLKQHAVGHMGWHPDDDDDTDDDTAMQS